MGEVVGVQIRLEWTMGLLLVRHGQILCWVGPGAKLLIDVNSEGHK